MNAREKTERKVFSFMEEHRMIEAGDTVVAGVSGGADSVCLLLLLLEYGRRTPFRLAVSHVNHGIRPDAGEDARYVERLCAERAVPFFLTETDVRALADREKCSEEDAGRRARYRAFAEAAGRLGGAKQAVAHNMGDSAETMLLHLFRGSGLKGLCGIEPVRDGVIRPLLCLERREIEEYLSERQVEWRTDSTNDGDDYGRNRIRHHILPYAEDELARGAVRRMCRTARLLSETEDYLRERTREALESCAVPIGAAESGRESCAELIGAVEPGRESCAEPIGAVEPGWESCAEPIGAVEPGREGIAESARENIAAPMKAGGAPPRGLRIGVAPFLALHPALQKRVLLAAAESLSPTGKDISAVHVEDVLTLFAREGNRDVSLPFGVTARRRYEWVLLSRGGEEEEPPQLEMSTFFLAKGQEVPKKKYTKWFDYDKIEESPIIRFRRTGDYLTIADGEGKLIHKTLKNYMVAEKIPRELRDRIPVVASGSHVLWLVGYRISEYFKVSGNTNRVLQVKLKRDCPWGETEEENV